MTGLECLKEELLKKGYSKKQANGKVVPGVLDIITNSQGQYADLAKVEDEIEGQKEELRRIRKNVKEERKMLSMMRADKQEIINEVNAVAEAKYRDVKEYIDKFFKALEECETAEGRDALKRAQIFVNTVGMVTKYDRPAFIVAYGSILSMVTYNPIDELERINPEIPKLKMRDRSVTRFGERKWITDDQEVRARL